MDFKKFQIKRNKLASIQGATSTTLYKTVGFAESRCENEYEDSNGNGELDEVGTEGGSTPVGCE